jgi:L-alanine-DL-glutamate epimerase-like enolase superfamily enzyme
MNIEKVTVDLLKVPVNLAYEAAGHAVSHNWHIVSKVHLDNGIQGVGFLVNTRPALINPLFEATRELSKLLLNNNVTENEHLFSVMSNYGNWVGPGGFLNMAISSLDIAIWDAKAKLSDQSVCQLLGGNGEDVQSYASDGLWYSMPLDDLITSARRHIESGHTRIKLRIGKVDNITEHVERINILKQNFTDIKIMVDATESWSLSEAKLFSNELEKVGIIWLEDPISHTNLKGLRQIRDHIKLPIAAGEHLYTMQSFRDTVQSSSIDTLIIDLARVGGITPWIKVAHVAEAEEVLVAGHVLPEFHVHLLSAVNNGYLVEDMPRSEGIVKTKMKVSNGRMEVPDGPGFGIEFDEKAYEEYKVNS